MQATVTEGRPTKLQKAQANVAILEAIAKGRKSREDYLRRQLRLQKQYARDCERVLKRLANKGILVEPPNYWSPEATIYLEIGTLADLAIVRERIGERLEQNGKCVAEEWQLPEGFDASCDWVKITVQPADPESEFSKVRFVYFRELESDDKCKIVETVHKSRSLVCNAADLDDAALDLS